MSITSNLFIEKPLTLNLSEYKKLYKILLEKKLKILVGYNMRFTDRLIYLKKIINEGKYGKILNVNINVDTNFVKWRKGKDYLNTVTAQKKLGGGVISELSHETDYIHYLFGKPSDVIVKDISCNNRKFNIETHIIALFHYKKFKNKVTMNLNMLSNTNNRTCQIIFESAIINLDHIKNNIVDCHKKKKGA